MPAQRLGFSQSTYPPDRAKVGFYPVPRFLCGSDADGSGQRRLSDGGLVAQYSDEKPAFSRDGRRVAFVRRFGLDVRSRRLRIVQQSPTEEALAVANADGSQPRALTGRDFVFAGRPAWSPDGSTIYFGAARRGDQGIDLYSVNADGTSLTRLTTDQDAAEFAPAVSPDGKTLLYTRYAYYRPEHPEAEGYQVVRVTGGGPGDVLARGANPAWAPDGRTIFFSGPAEPSRGGPDARIFVIGADGTGRKQLEIAGLPRYDTLEFLPTERFPVVGVSPDGTKLAFSWAETSVTGSFGQDIYVANRDGTALRNITRSPLYEQDPTWTVAAATRPGGAARCALFGTAAPVGTAGDDVFIGMSGAQGRGGNDTFFGGSGTHRGDGGDDVFITTYTGGPVTFRGGRGNDVITPGHFSSAAVVAYGDEGDDFFFRVGGTFFGGAGDDIALGVYGGAERLLGQAGDDLLEGHSGRDRLMGGPGRDRLYGGREAGHLAFRRDADLLVGGPGHDLLDGDDGDDTFLARDGERDIIRGGYGHDAARVDVGRDAVHEVERRLR